MILDPIDRLLISELQNDSSLGLEELGVRVGLSRNACWRRIKALERSGLIARRVAILDASVAGYPLTVFIHLRVTEHSDEMLEGLSGFAADSARITGVFRMSGEADYLLRAQVADVADYDLLYRALRSQLETADISASFVLETLKDTTALPF